MQEKKERIKVLALMVIVLGSTIAAAQYLSQYMPYSNNSVVSISFSPTYVTAAPGELINFSLQVSGGIAYLIVVEFNDGTSPLIISRDSGIVGTVIIRHRFMAEGDYKVVAAVVAGTGLNIRNITLNTTFPTATCIVHIENSPPAVQVVLGTVPPLNLPPEIKLPEVELPPPPTTTPTTTTGTTSPTTTFPIPELPSPPGPDLPGPQPGPPPQVFSASYSSETESKVDNQGPMVFVINETETLTLSANISDTLYDLRRIRVFWRINGISSTNITVNVSFNDSGVYPGYFMAIDPWGAVSCKYFFIIVRNNPPNAVLRVSGKILRIGDTIIAQEDEPIIFDASLSTDDPSDIDKLRYIWIFGDGVVEEGVTVSHIYSESGTYIARLCVIDPEGYKSYRNITINVVNPSPEVSLSGVSEMEEGNTYVCLLYTSPSPRDRG